VSAIPSSPLAQPPALEARVVYAGYGGVGIAIPGAVPDAWAAAIVEVRSPAIALSGVRVAAITLVDSTGGVVARATPPIDARITPGGREPYDFSEAGTTRFDGVVAKGGTVLLRLHAPLDTKLERFGNAPPDTRARIEIVANNGEKVVIQALSLQWPTA
jgi:hypothetical protein